MKAKYQQLLDIAKASNSIVFGILVIILPDITVALLSILYGCLLLIYAIVGFLEYLSCATQKSLATFVGNLLLAILLLAVVPRLLESTIFYIIIGCIYLAKGIFMIYHGDAYRRIGNPLWKRHIIGGAIRVAIAIPLLALQDISAIQWIFGIALILEGISKTIKYISSTKGNTNNTQPTVEYTITDDN